MRTILLATVAGVLLAGNVVAHADWRNTIMTPGDYRKDAQYDFKDLRTKRPNEPPPIQFGKLEGGIKIEHEPGSRNDDGCNAIIIQANTSAKPTVRKRQNTTPHRS